MYETRARTGVWVCVMLQPGESRHARIYPAELPRDETGQLIAQRDLTADRKAGRTGYQCRKEVRESVSQNRGKIDIQPLLAWTLSNGKLIYSVRKDSLISCALSRATTPQELVWSLRAVMSEHPNRRNTFIEAAAHAVARLFWDEQSVSHYCRVLHRATEAEFEGVAAYTTLEGAMIRTLHAISEVPLKRPGAYLMCRLHEAGWLDSVYRKSRIRRP